MCTVLNSHKDLRHSQVSMKIFTQGSALEQEMANVQVVENLSDLPFAYQKVRGTTIACRLQQLLLLLLSPCFDYLLVQFWTKACKS